MTGRFIREMTVILSPLAAVPVSELCETLTVCCGPGCLKVPSTHWGQLIGSFTHHDASDTTNESGASVHYFLIPQTSQLRGGLRFKNHSALIARQ